MRGLLRQRFGIQSFRKLWRPRGEAIRASPDHFETRRALSLRYIKGAGLEIGALHLPLPVAPDVHVRYVDRVPREESVRQFPELEASHIVTPSIIEDGLSLASIRPSSQDFIIANHVLEHSSNPFHALTSWSRVLRPDGIVFAGVPIADRCFDKGRPVTPIQHIREDYALSHIGDQEEANRRNRRHYQEWITMSVVNISKERGQHYEAPVGAGLEKELDTLVAAAPEIHFHTFAVDSFAELLRVFTSEIDRSMKVETVVDNDVEVIGLLRKE